MCQEIANRYVSCSSTVFQTTLQFMECMGLTNWPYFSCPVELTLVSENVSILAATITEGIAVPTNITPQNSQYNIHINGVTCDTNSILTIAFSNIETLFCNSKQGFSERHENAAFDVHRQDVIQSEIKILCLQRNHKHDIYNC